MLGNYILADDHRTPVPCDDMTTWGEWMGTADRHVGHDMRNGIRVSTVFLGLDHGFGPGAPVLWETMIFGGPHDEYQERYTSYDDALAGHARAVALAFGENN